MLAWLEQVLGALLVLTVLVDVFLTVLYARAGTGIISDRLARSTWEAFRRLSRAFGRHRGQILSFCGPTILVLLILTWALVLTLGAALVMHPYLGTAVTAQGGETPTDFVTAMYAGGISMAIVGSGNFAPQTPVFRLIYLFNALIGTSVVSLTLTYVMQVYNALQQRNQLGLKIHVLTTETGDAAELIARLGPRGQFSAGYSDLATLGSEMSQIKEAHHFYPVLFYFRFREPYYSVSRSTLVALDTVTLIRSSLEDAHLEWLKESAAVEQLWRASLMLVTMLEETFLPGGVPDRRYLPHNEVLDGWRYRYSCGVQRLRQASIETVTNGQAGVEAYVAMRNRWHLPVMTLAAAMDYSMGEIDPVSRDAHPANDGTGDAPAELRQS